MDELIKDELNCLHEQIRILREEKENLQEQVKFWRDITFFLKKILDRDHK